MSAQEKRDDQQTTNDLLRKILEELKNIRDDARPRQPLP